MMSFSKYSWRLLIAAGLAVSATGAFAQSSATGTGNATATVIRPISITNGPDLVFGNVVPSVAGGTLTLTAASPAVPTAAGISQPGTQTSTVTAAVFNVAGEPTFNYSIVVQAGAAIITGPAAATMTVDNFTSSKATGTLVAGGPGGSGTDSFFVGGRLNVGSNQAPGSYTGTFTVTVAYN